MQQIGKPVKGKDFIGREKELTMLMQYIKMGQSVVLIAPRRFGKTSLVLEALSQLKKQKYYTAFIDIFTNPTLDLLSSAITQEVLQNHKLHKQFAKAKNSAVAMIQNIKLKTVLEDFQFIVGFVDDNKDSWELLSESVDFVDSFAKKHSAKMVCAYDEFGDIKKFDSKGGLIKMFRSKIQQHNNSTYIFSGSYESVMQNMFVSSKAPFYRLAHIIHIGYLDKTSISKYLKNKFTDLKISLPDDFVEGIVETTMGHPYYSQLAVQQVVLFNVFNRRTPSLNELLDQMLATEKDYLEKSWEDISNNREFIYTIRAIAENSKNVYSRLKAKNINVGRATKTLEGMGILFKDKDKGYYLSDPLLKQWILKNL
jgi:AAA+ ATPase superfamily predicted ATPase